jgi:hypothetical protein
MFGFQEFRRNNIILELNNNLTDFNKRTYQYSDKYIRIYTGVVGLLQNF